MRFPIRATMIAAVVTAVPLLAAAAQGAPKLAYVNTQALLAEAPGSARADSAFQREMAAYQQSVQRMRDSLQAMLAAYQEVEPTLTPEQRTERQNAIRTRELEYNQRDQQAQQQLTQRRQELVEPIMDMIQQVLDEIRETEGYALIFDVASEANTIVAADRNLDITDRALQQLRRMSPGTAQTEEPRARPAGATPPPAGARRPPPPGH